MEGAWGPSEGREVEKRLAVLGKQREVETGDNTTTGEDWSMMESSERCGIVWAAGGPERGEAGGINSAECQGGNLKSKKHFGTINYFSEVIILGSLGEFCRKSRTINFHFLSWDACFYKWLFFPSWRAISLWSRNWRKIHYKDCSKLICWFYRIHVIHPTCSFIFS